MWKCEIHVQCIYNMYIHVLYICSSFILFFIKKGAFEFCVMRHITDGLKYFY
jgi:hypothetical protein